ncbi:MAG: primosomal protein N' [Gemmatimonadota bacterium]|nr:MAG: primosomal protein N' [Gemmatimonadota bacterium]
MPALRPLDYAIPHALADRVEPGTRVVVPVRSRELIGMVLSVDTGPTAHLKPVLLVPDARPLLSPQLLKLGQWIAGYYSTPIGICLKSVLPAALWGRSRLMAEVRNPAAASGGASAHVLRELERSGGRVAAATLSRKLQRPVWDVLQRLERAGAVALSTDAPNLGPAAGTERVLVLTEALPSLVERERVFGRASRQRAAYEVADALGGEVHVQHLTGQLGFSSAVLKGLVARKVARIEDREHLRDPFQGGAVTVPPQATDAQSEACAKIRGTSPGGAAVLFGVTGSGKTLVYLEAFRRDAAHGAGVIVLVPEISLTSQTIARVRGVFGESVAVLHSGLSDAERSDAWRALAAGRRRVAVGARSAVFAPVQRLTAIIIDEEHDASYKNGEAPRYHARDVALRRATIEGARVVLGSATPSLETWAARDRLRVVSLPHRVQAQRLPEVQLVDLRAEPQVAESGAVPWSQILDQGVSAELSAGSQAILLLNRRGFAHFLQCSSCGVVCECPHCSISLTVHHTPERMRCHYCGYGEPIPTACGQCGATAQGTRGTGTQLLESWLAERFPGARLARMDADTTSAKWSHHRILEAVGQRRVDILFGTQMIAKGLDFPGVTLVGVVEADTGLHLPDFRAAERTFQLIAQVAGRAGRGPKGGRVLVQSRTPDHYALQAAARHDFVGFAELELEARRDPPYPPHVSLVNIVVSGMRDEAVASAAAEVADWMRGLVAAHARDLVDVIGPAPAPLARVKRRWRWHILVRSRDRPLFDRIIRYATQKAPYVSKGPVRVVFDRDPVSVM